jgi:hypothetical protein
MDDDTYSAPLRALIGVCHRGRYAPQYRGHSMIDNRW